MCVSSSNICHSSGGAASSNSDKFIWNLERAIRQKSLTANYNSSNNVDKTINILRSIKFSLNKTDASYMRVISIMN